MALLENRPFGDEPVEMWGIHVVIAQSSNCVVPLLVRDDENDIWTLVSHVGISAKLSETFEVLLKVDLFCSFSQEVVPVACAQEIAVFRDHG